MKGCFSKTGKYGAGVKSSVVVTEEHVEEETLFDIDPFYADYFIKAGVFHPDYGVVEDEKPGDFSADGLDDMKVDDLKAFAKEKEIDLGDAKKKDDILAVIKEALKPEE